MKYNNKSIITMMFMALSLAMCWNSAFAWVSNNNKSNNRSVPRMTLNMGVGNLHGQNSCFLPLKQLDQDYYAPRIVQIAGPYPGVTREEFFAVTSEPSPELGQWTYDFSDPDGPQLGTVAIEGSNVVASAVDPVVLIAEHTSLAVPMPEAIKEAVDLVVLVDRAENKFSERKFLVLDIPGQGISIGAFPSKADLPPNAEIIGRVVLCQIPWLPSMKPTKTGFLEVDEYF